MSTFSVLFGPDRGWCVRVSELGPFVDLHVPRVGFFPAVESIDHDRGFLGPPPAIRNAMAQTLSGREFVVVDPLGLCNRLTGFRVYLFRHNADITLGDTLFYRQD